MTRVPPIVLAAFLVFAAGCSGSVDFSPIAHPAPSSGPSGVLTPTTNGSPVTTVSLVLGTSPSSTFTVTETGYTGNFTATSSDATVVTVAAGSAPAATARQPQSTSSATSNGTFTLTAVDGGTATITITDANGNSSSFPVSVTSTEGVIYSESR